MLSNERIAEMRDKAAWLSVAGHEIVMELLAELDRLKREIATTAKRIERVANMVPAPENALTPPADAEGTQC